MKSNTTLSRQASPGKIFDSQEEDDFENEPSAAQLLCSDSADSWGAALWLTLGLSEDADGSPNNKSNNINKNNNMTWNSIDRNKEIMKGMKYRLMRPTMITNKYYRSSIIDSCIIVIIAIIFDQELGILTGAVVHQTHLWVAVDGPMAVVQRLSKVRKKIKPRHRQQPPLAAAAAAAAIMMKNDGNGYAALAGSFNFK